MKLVEYLNSRSAEFSEEELKKALCLYQDKKFVEFNKLLLNNDIENCNIDYMDCAALVALFRKELADFTASAAEHARNEKAALKVLDEIVADQALSPESLQHFFGAKNQSHPPAIVNSEAQRYLEKISQLGEILEIKNKFVREYQKGNRVCLIVRADDAAESFFDYYKNDAHIAEILLEVHGLEISPRQLCKNDNRQDRSPKI